MKELRKINYEDLGKEFVKQLRGQGCDSFVNDDTEAWFDDILRAEDNGIPNGISNGDDIYWCRFDFGINKDNYQLEFYVKYNDNGEEEYYVE